MPNLARVSEAPKARTYPEAARELLHATLLDAAGDLLREQAWSDISMAAIATQAGVSRQTLYNEFGSRDAFAQAFALREAAQFLDAVEHEIAVNADNPAAAIRSAFVTFLHIARENPMVHAIVVREPGADELFALFTTRGGPVVDLATERIATVILENWPGSDAGQVRVGAEAMVRLAISHAGLPNGSEEHAAESVAAVLAPFAEATLR